MSLAPCATGEMYAARTCAERALDMRQHDLGVDRLSTARSLRALGSVLPHQSQPDSAADSQRRALHIWQAYQNWPEYGATLAALAECAQRRGALDEVARLVAT